MRRLPRSANIPAMLSKQWGVSMLEVLISIVVLAVGLLGFAGLQMLSLKNSNSAYQRSQATMLAYDVIDRIRADMPNRGSYNVNYGSAGAYPEVITWKQNVKAALGGSPSALDAIADASVFVDINNKVTINIKWDDNRDGADLVTFTTETAL